MPFGPHLPTLPEGRHRGLACLLQRQVLRDLVLSQSLGAAIRHAREVDERALVAELASAQLAHVECCASLYESLGWGDVLDRVSEDARAAPIVESWVEVQVALVLLAQATLAELAPAPSMIQGSAAETLGRILTTARVLHALGSSALRTACAAEATRRHAQALVPLWLDTALGSLRSSGGLGRGGRLHARATAEVMHRYLEALSPTLGACDLDLPTHELVAVGLEVVGNPLRGKA